MKDLATNLQMRTRPKMFLLVTAGWGLGLLTAWLPSILKEMSVAHSDVAIIQKAPRLVQKAIVSAQTNRAEKESDFLRGPRLEPDTVSIPRTILHNLRFSSIFPASDRLNDEAFLALRITPDQIGLIRPAFAAAIAEVKQSEISSVTTESQDDGSVILKFPASSPGLEQALSKFKESILSAVPDGRADLIYQNLVRTASIGYSEGARKEIKIVYARHPDGTEHPAVMDYRVTKDPISLQDISIGGSLPSQYFMDRYGLLLKAQSLKLEGGLIVR